MFELYYSISNVKKVEQRLSNELKYYYMGQAQWLIPVIPALPESEAGRSPEVRSSRSAWPT